jgi:hypothetical protein
MHKSKYVISENMISILDNSTWLEIIQNILYIDFYTIVSIGLSVKVFDEAYGYNDV